MRNRLGNPLAGYSCSILPLSLFLSIQFSGQFLQEAKITRRDGKAIIVSNSPRPLEQAIAAIREDTGWLIDYEEPVLTTPPDVVDATDPVWRSAHPNEKGYMRINGGFFTSQYPDTSSDSTGAMMVKTVNKVVLDYNISMNPGLYEVKTESAKRISVVGSRSKSISNSAEPRKPLLDSDITLQHGLYSGDEILGKMCKELSKSSGLIVVPGSYPSNLMRQTAVLYKKETRNTARVILADLSSAAHIPIVWELMWDPNVPMYVLNVSIASSH